MRKIYAALLIFLSCPSFYAQDKDISETRTPDIFQLYNDPCGNPAEESQLYDNRKGKVTKILSANKVLFEQVSVNGNKKKEMFAVKLVGIDLDKNKTALKNKLQDILLNQDVEIFGNLRKRTNKEFGGVIWYVGGTEDIPEVNIYLLEKGIAKYKPFESANLVSMVMPCRLQKAEHQAKEAKIGIWAK
ncbi:MAG: hypothetical protein ABIP78_06600 [Pyrinomonadaceae bacterium]